MSSFKAQTHIAIDGDKFSVNGDPMQRGVQFQGVSIEGLLLNSRMANAIFDDENPLTRHLWAYPDTGHWDANRNTDELIAMLPTYKARGLGAIDINLQGAAPLGYYRSDDDALAPLIERIHQVHPDAGIDEIWAGVPTTWSQPWITGAFTPEGALKPDHLERAARIIEAADDVGLAVCVGLFYFGQDERLQNEDAVIRALDEAVHWILERGYSNVLLEINNECDIPRYEHDILCPPRVHELIERAQATVIDGRRLLVGTSFTRRMLPTAEVVAISDYILLHGNGMDDPNEVTQSIRAVRSLPTYRGQPIAFNEDDHFDFDQPTNNFAAALIERAGWGFFDPGSGAGGSHAYGDYAEGFQNPPINWSINTPRKQAFFAFLSALTASR